MWSGLPEYLSHLCPWATRSQASRGFGYHGAQASGIGQQRHGGGCRGRQSGPRRGG